MGTVRSKAIVTAVILIMTAAGVIMLIRPDSGGQEAETADPDVVLENVELLGSDQGVHRWKLLAGTLRQEQNLVYFDRVDELVLLEDGEPKCYVYADSGVWSPRENRLRLEGGVVVQDQAGLSMTADGLVWNSQSGLLDFMGNISVIVNQGGKADE